MKVVDAIAHALKAERVDILFAYPVNPLIEAAAAVVAHRVAGPQVLDEVREHSGCRNVVDRSQGTDYDMAAACQEG